MLKAVLVEDELHCANRIEKLMEKHKSAISLVKICSSVEEGKAAIDAIQPNVVFLDIELRDKTGFDLLRLFSEINFEVIFTTAFNNFAIKAFKHAALDYLMKPVLEEDFDKSMEKLMKKDALVERSKNFDLLLNNLNEKSSGLKKIAVPTLAGYEFVEISEIVRLESNGNYTSFKLLSDKPIMASKTLKVFEDMLSETIFFRIHKSHLINLNHIEKYVKGKGGYVIMADKSTIEVAVRRKDAFMKKLL